MRLTSRERYAVRAMATLAAAYGQGPLPLPAVARQQGIPHGYLEHIARQLRRSGLVVARRGAAGGYELARHPNEISVADVLRAMDGAVLPTNCGTPGDCSFRGHTEDCVTRPIWERIQAQVESSLSEITLSSVASRMTAPGVEPSDEGSDEHRG